MEVSEVAKAVSEFESKLTPVTPQMKAMAAGVVEEEPPPPPEEVPPAPPAEHEACITKDFKKMVGGLSSDYIGKDGKDIQDLVIEFLNSLPECKE